MKLIDLSREIHHRTPVHPNHPPVIITPWNTHDEKKRFGDEEFSSMAFSISISDHSTTHVDAPRHFDARPGAKGIDEVPLENFYTEAICLDLSHVPLKHSITVEEMEDALAKSGQEIKLGDTVLIYMAVHDRLFGDVPAYQHDFPGLSLAAIKWLAEKGIISFGVEAVSPAVEGETNSRAHRACRDLGITHMECLCNLDKLLGKGRFRFIGFPLKFRGGTGSPIRAVAVLDE